MKILMYEAMQQPRLNEEVTKMRNKMQYQVSSTDSVPNATP